MGKSKITSEHKNTQKNEKNEWGMNEIFFSILMEPEGRDLTPQIQLLIIISKKSLMDWYCLDDKSNTVASRNSGFVRQWQIVHCNERIHYYKRDTS